MTREAGEARLGQARADVWTHILAIDPGPERSAYVVIDATYNVLWYGIESNAAVVPIIACTYSCTRMAIEMPKARGQRVGDDTFQTCFWAGVFSQAWRYQGAQLISRQEVVVHFCGCNAKGADAAIRQCLIDRYGPGKAKAIGTKKAPGPLYGIKKDIWQALAVGVYVLETMRATP